MAIENKKVTLMKDLKEKIISFEWTDTLDQDWPMHGQRLNEVLDEHIPDKTIKCAKKVL